MASQLPPLQILAFGAPKAHLSEEDIVFPTRKTLALLFYLAIETGEQPRRHLASLLWPDASPENSSASLRNTLNRLQKALRPWNAAQQASYLTISSASLALDGDAPVELDLAAIQRAYNLVNSGQLRRSHLADPANLALLRSAAGCYRGEFLAGFSLGDAPAFDDWVALQRETWHRRYGLILDRLSEIQFARGEFVAAAETCAQWIALDTLNEAAYRRKMRIHFAAGERSRALESYEICRTLLANELGVEPEPDTDALAARIRSQVALAHPTSQTGLETPRRAATSVDFLGSLFTGRSGEIQQLGECFERAAAGQPQVALLRGESGIGKTRLAQKFLAWAGAQGSEILRGGAFEGGSHLPFQPLVDALRLRHESGKPLDEALDAVWLAPLGLLLPEIRQRGADQTPALAEPGAFTAELTQSQLYESLVQLMLALANSAPLVIMIDDLQWADSATLDWLLYAVRRWLAGAGGPSPVRILLLGNLRSEALNPAAQGQSGGAAGINRWLTSLEREIAPLHLELHPLSEADTLQMLSAILMPPSGEFAQWLYAETRGHPYYLIESLKDLLEQRLLRPKRLAEGQWTFSLNVDRDFATAERVPSSVYAVIRSRLNRLSPNAFSLLAAGSVLESQLSFRRMLAIANIDEDAALSALDELISGRLLLESGETGASEYTFVNDMLRDVVYTEAGEARRQLFHRRALQLLAQEGESAAALAYHALAAGMAQEAYHHSLTAGRQALRVSALNEAGGHFERALQLVREEALPEMPAAAELSDLFNQLGRIYQRTDQDDKAAILAADREKLLPARKSNE